jgi:hypothetical protein
MQRKGGMEGDLRGLENRCPQGFVGSSPTPSATSEQDFCG